jgi:arsenate reductase
MFPRSVYPELAEYIGNFPDLYQDIPNSRTRDLEKVADFISTRISKGLPAHLIFICTHNSRRSHMGQLWAAAAAHCYEVPNVETFSGGTEATSVNINVINAMQEAGFRISSNGSGGNPVYSVRFSEDHQPIYVFSKRFNDDVNPAKDFCAVMTCSEADENCPIIPGAVIRVPITYEDPKAYDHTEREQEAYRERCFQIGKEMFYLFDKVKVE